MTPWFLLLLVALAGGIGSYYFRSRARSAEEALDRIKEVRDEWLAANRFLNEQLARAQAALRTRQEAEKQNDLEAAERASSDAGAASELLNRP